MICGFLRMKGENWEMNCQLYKLGTGGRLTETRRHKPGHRGRETRLERREKRDWGETAERRERDEREYRNSIGERLTGIEDDAATAIMS